MVGEARGPSGSCWARFGRFLLGAVLAVGLLAGLAEAYLRLFPPRDLQPYLGEQSSLTGLYVSDPDFGVRFRCWEALVEDNRGALDRFGPLQSPSGMPPIWAFFGNSFFQAPGMLADTARESVHDRRIFNLGRNERIEVRFAQIAMLLDHGFGPERIFIEVMPPDLIGLGEQPLATYHVTTRGAVTYQPRFPPGPAGWLTKHSRVALTAWSRTGLERGNPHFTRKSLSAGLTESLQGDVRHLFAGLARVTRAHRVPVTVLLIPGYSQAAEGASFAFQDQLAPLFRGLGLDVLDPRSEFCRYPNPGSLYLPDKHLTAAGNNLLLKELLAHVSRQAALARSTAEEPRR